MVAKILILNGPNLNMLGSREPEIYGNETLADIERLCHKTGEQLNLGVDFRQSNVEGELVTWIQESAKLHQGLILNAGAYTHTSVAILDALQMLKIPVIEVHLSNIFRREEFRHHSYVSKAARGVICGFGSQGYIMALHGISQMVK